LALSGCGAQPQRDVVSADRSSLDAARQALDDGAAGTSLAIAHGVLSSQPNNVAALTQAGDAEAVMGDRLSADTSYHRALRLAPHNVRARLGLAKMQIRDNLPGAEASFRAILADAPHDPVVLNDLGYVLDLQERHKEAQAVYLQALATDPNRLSVRVNFALSLALSGESAKAEQMLRDLAANSGATAKVRLDLAVAEVIAGHNDQAEATMSSDLQPQEVKAAMEGMEQLRPVPVVAR
jgi:Flp pilus assembly protein TadD